MKNLYYNKRIFFDELFVIKAKIMSLIIKIRLVLACVLFVFACIAQVAI